MEGLTYVKLYTVLVQILEDVYFADATNSAFSQFYFRGSLDLHYYKIYFRGSHVIREYSEIYISRKFVRVRYN